MRGKSIEGGTKYPIAAGDTLYIPANVVHQFIVEPGEAWLPTPPVSAKAETQVAGQDSGITGPGGA